MLTQGAAWGCTAPQARAQGRRPSVWRCTTAPPSFHPPGNLFTSHGDGFVEVLHATQRPGHDKADAWFQGTADAGARVRGFQLGCGERRVKRLKRLAEARVSTLSFLSGPDRMLAALMRMRACVAQPAGCRHLRVHLHCAHFDSTTATVRHFMEYLESEKHSDAQDVLILSGDQL